MPTGLAPDTIGARINGAIFGQAIGDALGHPNEFIVKGKRQPITKLSPDNKFTDDTQLFCAIGEALLTNPPHLDEEAFMNQMCTNFSQWRVKPLGGSHRAPGNACMEGARRYGKSCPSETGGVYTWQTCGDKAAKGNGSAMRSGIIGAMYWNFPDYAFRIGCMSSIPTHNNLEAILGSGLIAYLVAMSVQGTDWHTAVGDGLKICSDFDFTVPFYPQDLPKHDPEIPCPQFGVLGTDLENPNPWYAIGHMAAAYAYANANNKLQIPIFQKWNGDDNAVVPAVAAALFFNTRFSEFLKVVVAAVNYSGDCDTVGAISGCIAGARFGQDAILPAWRESIEMSDYLHDLCFRIGQASQGIELKAQGNYEIQL